MRILCFSEKTLYEQLIACIQTINDKFMILILFRTLLFFLTTIKHKLLAISIPMEVETNNLYE